MNCLERFAAQLIDTDKELFDVAEDDRCLRAPTVRIGVVESLLAEQHAAFAQQIHDVDVGVEDVFADKIGQTGFVSEAAVIIDRRQDRQFIGTSKIVIVFAVTRCDVDGAGAGIHRHKISGENNGSTRQKRMLHSDFVEFAAGK